MFKGKKWIFPLVLLSGGILRILFYTGFAYSDDAYYNFISYGIARGIPNELYLGYPICLIRWGFTGINGISFMLFSPGRLQGVIFPFVFSMLSMVLLYKASSSYFRSQGPAISALVLYALFPVDLVFSTMAFPDLICAFFLNLGLWAIFIAYRRSSIFLASLSGLCFFISFSFKEYAFYALVFLAVLFFYRLCFHGKFSREILASFLTLGIFLILECSFYLVTKNNFFYRLSILEENYRFCYYDFFPNSIRAYRDGQIGLFQALLTQFGLNIKYMLFRRFYVFLTLAALLYAFFLIRKKEASVLEYYFVIMCFLMVFFTSSFCSYKPMNLARSWYLYPLIMPAAMLAGSLLSRLNPRPRSVLIFVYVALSLYMAESLKEFFDLKNKRETFSRVLKAGNNKIYTDYFSRLCILSESDFRRAPSDVVPRLGGPYVPGDVVFYNKKAIEELRLQGFKYRDDFVLRTPGFRMLNGRNCCFLYQKVN